MEYTKDIILDLNNGQARNKKSIVKENVLKKIWKHTLKHKVITSIVIGTIGFILLDIYLITSFINILAHSI